MIEDFKEIEMDQLVKADWNYKEDSPDLVKKLVANIKRNGQIENIIVRLLATGFYEIINGNHRFDALEELEFTSAVCYDMGPITDASARRIAIETNETKFPTDQVAFAETFRDILEEFNVEELTVTMPYSENEIEGFKDLLDFPLGDLGSDAELELEGKKIVVTVDEETMQRWYEWKNRVTELTQDDSNEEAFRVLLDLGLRIDLAAEFVD